MKIMVLRNVVPCGLTNVHHHLEESAACVFRAEIKLFDKELCGHRRERSIKFLIQSHLIFAFPGLSFQFRLLYVSPLPSVSFITIFYYLLLSFILLFILHLPPLFMNVAFPQTHAIWLQQMLPIVYSSYTFFFSFVLFTYFILYVFASVMLFYLILHFKLWHLPQNSPF